MLDWYVKRNRREIIRQPLREIKEGSRQATNAAIGDAIAYFNRNGDMDMLRNAFKTRFATRLLTPKEESRYSEGTSDAMPTWYLSTDYREDVAAAIDCGHVEVVNTGLGIRIVQALGTQFTEPDMSFLYTDADDDESIENVEQLMQEIRSAGNFLTTACEMDMLSCMVESSWLHVFYKGDELQYDVIRPDSVTIKFGSKLTYRSIDGAETESYVDYTDIDDASAVIIHTASDKGAFDSAPDKHQYLAYVGCCEPDFPEGRYVIYQASEPWPLPDVGHIASSTDDKEIIYEHMEGDQVCNPLTWMRHHGTPEEQEMVTTEYPVVLWRGGHRILIGDTWPPVTTSLYDDCVELEMAWSRSLRYALLGARGQDIFKMGTGVRMPRSLDVITLDQGDEYEHTGWPASHSKDATSVLEIIQQQTASGFNVPGYMVIGQAQAPSGVSLAIQTQPLIHFRNRRTRLNENAMERLFNIEKALLVQQYPSEAGGLLTPTIKQKWDPGTWRMPMDELADSQAVTAQLDNKTIDLVHAVKRRHRLPTDKAAIKFIKDMADRDPEYTWEEAPKQSIPFNTPKKEDEEVEDEDFEANKTPGNKKART